ncbi:MAG: 2OG-Fe(II) oxygenase [Bacteroidota bacterium]
MNGIINPEHTTPEAIARYNEEFYAGHPCPYIVIDNFFRPEVADQLYNNFPKVEDMKVKRKSLNENKVEDYKFERWHPVFSDAKSSVTGEEFCEVMSKITDIDGLFVTTDNTGAGIHQGANNSYVDVHIDYNMSTQFNAWRRINMLVYLNKNWKDEYGGHLTLWDKGMTKMEKKVLPSFNRAVVFLTDENSPHGVNKVNVPEGETRKSFYVYYYTPVEEGVEYRDSKFLARPDESIVKRTLTTVKETLKVNIKSAMYKMGIKKLDFQDKNKG